jgi:hypothetical protein
MIAASGFILLGSVDSEEPQKSIARGKKLLTDTISLSLAPRAEYHYSENKDFVVDNCGGFEAILKNATIDNNPAHSKSKMSFDTGVVYADYFLIEAHNRLLRMSLAT